MSMGKAGWLLTGLVIGGGAGAGVTYLVLKEKFEKQLTEEVNALKAHYVERDQKMAQMNEERKKELEETVYSASDRNDFADYTKLYSANVGEETSSESIAAVTSYNEAVENTDDYSSAAEVISDEEWDNPEYDNYRKISVDYFEDGAVFETLSGEELDGFDLIAGEDWKDAFGEYTPNVVYVRNHDLKTDYEIIEQEGPHPIPEDE